MPYCHPCRRSDIGDRWEFCPRCGSELSAGAPAEAAVRGNGAPKDLKDVLIDFAVDAAEGFVRNKVHQKLTPLGRFVEQNVSGGAATAAAQPGNAPEWYQEAVRQKQPTPSRTEIVRLQAEDISKARMNTQMFNEAMTTMKSMNDAILRNLGNI